MRCDGFHVQSTIMCKAAHKAFGSRSPVFFGCRHFLSAVPPSREGWIQILGRSVSFLLKFSFSKSTSEAICLLIDHSRDKIDNKSTSCGEALLYHLICSDPLPSSSCQIKPLRSRKIYH